VTNRRSSWQENLPFVTDYPDLRVHHPGWADREAVRRSLSGMSILRQPLLLLARSDWVKRLVTAMPVSAGIVRSYVPGEDTEAAVRATAELVDEHLRVTLDHLGEDTLDSDQADATVQAYLDALTALSAHGLTRHAEVSVKLSAVGQAIPQQGHKIALENARTICRAARNAGTTVTLDMEDHTTTDATLATLRELRKDFPETGAVLQAYLHRSEADCKALAFEGSRVRLCKGAYDEPASVAFQSALEVDKSFVRCLKALMAGQGYPMVATHDPRMIRIASSLASRHGRGAGSYEFQMLYGIRPEEQRRLVAAGEIVRVYIPYGSEWYGYLMRRLAERPQNLTFFLRSLISKK
jgi:proline dehydrogenase